MLGFVAGSVPNRFGSAVPVRFASFLKNRGQNPGNFQKLFRGTLGKSLSNWLWGCLRAIVSERKASEEFSIFEKILFLKTSL